jgi:hypothetical protein
MPEEPVAAAVQTPHVIFLITFTMFGSQTFIVILWDREKPITLPE